MGPGPVVGRGGTWGEGGGVGGQPVPGCLLLIYFFLALEQGRPPSVRPSLYLCLLLGCFPKDRTDGQGWQRSISVDVATAKREASVPPFRGCSENPCSAVGAHAEISPESVGKGDASGFILALDLDILKLKAL